MAELTGIPTENFFRSTASVHHFELSDLTRDEGVRALDRRTAPSAAPTRRGPRRAAEVRERRRRRRAIAASVGHPLRAAEPGRSRFQSSHAAFQREVRVVRACEPGARSRRPRRARSGTRRGRARCCGRSCRGRTRRRPRRRETSRARAVLGGERERALDEALARSRARPCSRPGYSSPVRWTSQTSRSSLPAAASGSRCSAASNSAVVAEWLSSAPRGGRAQRVAAALVVVDVLHVRGVVVVAHDHGLRRDAGRGSSSRCCARRGVSWFLAQPSIHGNAKSVSHRNT